MPRPEQLHRVYLQLEQINLEISRLTSRVEELHLPAGERFLSRAREHSKKFTQLMRSVGGGQTWEDESESLNVLHASTDTSAESLIYQLQTTLYGLLYGLKKTLEPDGGKSAD